VCFCRVLRMFLGIFMGEFGFEFVRESDVKILVGT
jgi:hypothetical protein